MDQDSVSQDVARVDAREASPGASPENLTDSEAGSQDGDFVRVKNEKEKDLVGLKPLVVGGSDSKRRKSDMLNTISSKGMSEASFDNSSGFRRREKSQGSFVESSNQNSDINRLSSS